MNNPFSLRNKTILVTGASSGIGRGIAIECSKMGAKLIITGRNEQRLKECLKSLDGDCHTMIVADISNQEQIDNLIEQLPQIQGCVLCAGIPNVSLIKYYNREQVKNLFNVNSIAPMMITSRLLKKKKIKKGGSIVIIASISGVFIGTKTDSAYCASKAALSGFTKAAAVELASSGIRVNNINPGLVPTGILDSSNAIFAEERHLDVAANNYPLGRFGTPQDIAYGAIYLLSDASSWITGINLPIDGGYTSI